MHNLRETLYLKWLPYIVLVVAAAATSRAQDITTSAIGELVQVEGPNNPNQDHEALARLYRQREYQPLWFKDGRTTLQAAAVLGVLSNAASYGLLASDYNGVALASRSAAIDTFSGDEQTRQMLPQLDVDISLATLHFIRHLHFGRIDPRKAGFNLGVIRTDEYDLVTSLNELATAADVLHVIAKIEPQYLHYHLLKVALARYRQLMTKPDLTNLPLFNELSIKPGGQYAGAPALRRLLSAEQDMSDAVAVTDEDTTLDPQLVEGLQNYQKRHGLLADGALGKQTFVALTTPFAFRVRQIELTLERWRWLPLPQSPMIVVNIPQFRLFAFGAADDHESTLLRMDVIVGQAFEHTQTPVFLADMKYVVFRPYWDVPADIVRRELLGQIVRNPEYLQREQFELVDGDGDNSPVIPATDENIAQLAASRVRLRQRPGANNALGEVKFMLPNSYNVYLHSTPAKRLFAAPRRAFSHGCIRVSDPAALAEYVLRNAADSWTRERIEDAMQGKENQRVYLTAPIPVMIVYGTAMANEAGRVQFFNDIYGYDGKLEKMLSLGF